MAKKTGIEWTDSTWNPIRGCTRVSEGCRNCYAEVVAARFSGEGQPYEGLANFVSLSDGSKDARWTGDIKVVSHMIDAPIRWKKPRLIFVNSMSDMFHPNVSDETIDTLFAVMAKADHHQFQVLTKRPERMLSFSIGFGIPPNVWMGVSVENVETLSRLDYLEQVKADVRFVSAEPLLGNISPQIQPYLKWLNWVIVGGESGVKARPMNIDWARDIYIDCRIFRVPYFFKQMGGKGGKDKGDSKLIGYNGDPYPFQHDYPIQIERLRFSQQEFKQ